MAAAPGSRGEDKSTIIGSVDDDGSEAAYVIADITEDEAWVSMRAADALELPSWR